MSTNLTTYNARFGGRGFWKCTVVKTANHTRTLSDVCAEIFERFPLQPIKILEITERNWRSGALLTPDEVLLKIFSLHFTNARHYFGTTTSHGPLKSTALSTTFMSSLYIVPKGRDNIYPKNKDSFFATTGSFSHDRRVSNCWVENHPRRKVIVLCFHEVTSGIRFTNSHWSVMCHVHVDLRYELDSRNARSRS